MSLDYRTPCPRKPICTDKPFARFPTWSVQHFARGRWLAIARRVPRSAAIEWAEGYCAGASAALRGAAPTYEEIWVVGPDGNGYLCLEAPLSIPKGDTES
jgi:hypothetical protein